MRINRYIAACGVASRRGADRLIEDGLVMINGRRAELGDEVTPEDEVTLSGRPLFPVEKKVVLAYNKPVGVVCSAVSQGRDEINIIDALNYETRIFPVGRLDKSSRGLILLTNDGKLAESIMSASSGCEKEYEVTLDDEYGDDLLKALGSGVEIELDTGSYRTRPCRVYRIDERRFGIVLTEGKNRQIRRMCAALGSNVVDLLRVRVMDIRLGDIPEGKYREIDPDAIGFGAG